MLNGSQKYVKYYVGKYGYLQNSVHYCMLDIIDIEILILMKKRLLNKKFLNHKRGISFSPIFCNLSIIMLNSRVSNTEDKSSSISC